ncbi:MAG: pyrimidine-nucleoside phosphorylase [Clostridiaceae bacterium]|nr:pyrimidine-nucleoside phosphorylase [Clostridiaceae bacterium]
MFVLDLILKKRNGMKLSREEIEYFVRGYTDGDIEDYQAAAFLMAVYFQGMDADETLYLTEAMLHSGDIVDLSEIPGIKTDKHSTGGVGDKTTLIVAPVVASCGVPVAKMSGRGLGHTGGTIDKLESIPGFQTSLTREQLIRNVKEIGLAVAGQTGNLAPADKKIYALRDVTGTVENISLIAASIMSKKLASGSDAIVLDVKVGSGAFMKSMDDAGKLAKMMVDISRGAGKKAVAVLTRMDNPLGMNIGNALEVAEAVDILKGHGPEDLREVCIELAANMLMLGGKGTLDSCRELAARSIADGSAFRKLIEMVERQGGDPSVLEDTRRLPAAPVKAEYKAEKAGYIIQMNAEKFGMASVALGAGRKTIADKIDPSAGIVLLKKYGDIVEKGEPIAVLHTSEKETMPDALKILEGSVITGEKSPPEVPIILGRIE